MQWDSDMSDLQESSSTALTVRRLLPYNPDHRQPLTCMACGMRAKMMTTAINIASMGDVNLTAIEPNVKLPDLSSHYTQSMPPPSGRYNDSLADTCDYKASLYSTLFDSCRMVISCAGCSLLLF